MNIFNILLVLNKEKNFWLDNPPKKWHGITSCQGQLDLTKGDKYRVIKYFPWEKISFANATNSSKQQNTKN